MKRSWIVKSLLLASCCVAPGVAWAQDNASSAPQASADSTNQVEEVVVTAQRREENLQSVPIAITAVSQAELNNRTVNSIADLQSLAPNVHFDAGTQGTGVVTIGIRGVKQGSTELSNEQAVATYVDGVYQGTPLASSILLGPDVSGVEILRGPQGTLFGRNTVGGALLINTARPSDFFEGRLMAGAGDYGRREFQGMVNLPVGDQAALRVNFARTLTDGFAEDSTTGNKIGDEDLSFVRAQFRVNPTDNLELVARAHWFRSESGGNLLQPIFINPGSLTATVGALYLGLTPGPASFAQVQDFYLHCGGGSASPNTHDKCYGAENPDHSNYEEWAGSFTATLNVTPNLQLKSISAYTEYSQDQSQDYDGSPFQVLWNDAAPYGHVFTQELQVNGSFNNDTLKFASGVFYYQHNNNDHAFNQILGTLTGARSRGELISFHEDKSLGVYAQGTQSLGDRLRVTLGLRYTSESKDAATTQYTSAAPPVNRTCTLPVPNAACVADSSIDFNSTDYTVGFDYDLAENILFYGRVARGFLAGGINQRSTTGVPFTHYDPEIAINHEIGLKGDFFNHRARLNLAVFEQDVEGLQKSVPRTFLNVSGDPVTVVAQINAAQATIWGAEAELSIVPFENFEVNMNVGYLNQTYDKFLVDGPGGPQTFDLSSTNFFQSPDWTIGISPRYTLATPLGRLRAQVDWYWQSDSDLSPPTAAPITLAGRNTVQDAYALVDARLSLEIGDNTEIAIWGKNLADQRYLNSILDVSTSLGFMNGKVGDPRTFGVQITHQF